MLCSELMCSSNDTTLLSKADRSRPDRKNVGKNQCKSEVREFQFSVTTAEKEIIGNQWDLKPQLNKLLSVLLEARENASDQVAIDASFDFDWLRGWCEYSGPINERSEAKVA